MEKDYVEKEWNKAGWLSWNAAKAAAQNRAGWGDKVIAQMQVLAWRE